MQPEIKDLTFEVALEELEEIVARLEAGELTLDEAVMLYERGQMLAEHCGAQLESATLRVEQLSAEGKTELMVDG